MTDLSSPTPATGPIIEARGVYKTYEASFVALTAILLGTGLGLVMGWNLIHDAQAQPGNENLAFTVPWVNLLVIFAAVYAAALLARWLPARKAARVYPAEALRYE